MLLNKLYQITLLELSGTRDKVTAVIMLNKDHKIFEGHFPGNPILPGVCTVQIVREILESVLDREIMLTRAGNIKYLGFINPLSTPEVSFDISLKTLDTGALSCSASVSSGGINLCSFKGEYADAAV
jgi:3-hydroxyacyl-[acyl-carrier-protein] dehydratase